MKQYPIFQLLDGKTISSKEHIIKSSEAIYERICRKFGLNAEECVFADDLAENVAAARRFGMQAVLFQECRAV